MKKRKLTLNHRTAIINNSLDLGDVNLIVNKYDYYFQGELETSVSNKGRSFTNKNTRRILGWSWLVEEIAGCRRTLKSHLWASPAFKKIIGGVPGSFY